MLSPDPHQPPLSERPLVVLIGPTAVGKTEISLHLAERIHGEIVSADSRLFYRGMDIGTAKPSPEDRRRVPHHLIDIADPSQTVGLSVFQRAASDAIADVHKRGNIPIFVGGTGQYIRSVIEGWTIPPQVPHPELRTSLERWGKEIGATELHRRLSLVDPRSASRIEPNNLRRTVRALEVIFFTGRRFSDLSTKSEPYYQILQIGLTRPRTELYSRIDDRIEKMLADGFISEVQTLMKKGYERDLPSMSAIGYRELIRYIDGEIDLQQAVLEIKRQTRIFVRRQANWFKLTDPAIHWFLVNGGTLPNLETLVRQTFHLS